MSSYSSSTSSESSRSSSTFSTSSEDSVSSLNLSSLSLTSTTDRSISCPPTQFTPVDSHITWYKSQRGINICMDGYTYQIQGPVKAGVKWKCHLNRDSNIKCPCFITTSVNTGTSDSPIYTYIKATTNHNHHPNPVTQKINIFISKLKDLSSDSNTGPSLSKYYQLVAQMKFTREEMAKLPTFYSLSKYTFISCVYSHYTLLTNANVFKNINIHVVFFLF